MDSKTLLQTIREEIEQRKEGCSNHPAYKELESLLSLLNTIQVDEPQPKEIEKTARISPGMLSNFGTSSFVLDVCLTPQELTELSLAPGLSSGRIKIKILCE